MGEPGAACAPRFSLRPLMALFDHHGLGECRAHNGKNVAHVFTVGLARTQETVESVVAYLDIDTPAHLYVKLPIRRIMLTHTIKGPHHRFFPMGGEAKWRWLFLSLAAFFNLTSLFNGISLNTMVETYSTMDGSHTTIPVFYNLFVQKKKDGPRVGRIVAEQMQSLKPNLHGPVYVTSIGTQLDIPNTTLLHHVSNGTELITLHSLWQYCQRHPQEKVVYLHSKGSFHPHKANDHLRRFLTKAALSKECAHLPSECNVCSVRFSPSPHAHTPGNMWLARCSYVQQLIDPNVFEHAMDQVYPGKTRGLFRNGQLLSCRGLGRFSAEHWIHSHPGASPCDLYEDESFIAGYFGIPKPTKRYGYNLSMAPRFPSIKTYIRENCKGRPLGERFNEYKSLYSIVPEKYESAWWGWRLEEYNRTLTLMTSEKGHEDDYRDGQALPKQDIVRLDDTRV